MTFQAENQFPRGSAEDLNFSTAEADGQPGSVRAEDSGYGPTKPSIGGDDQLEARGQDGLVQRLLGLSGDSFACFLCNAGGFQGEEDASLWVAIQVGNRGSGQLSGPGEPRVLLSTVTLYEGKACQGDGHDGGSREAGKDHPTSASFALLLCTRAQHTRLEVLLLVPG